MLTFLLLTGFTIACIFAGFKHYQAKYYKELSEYYKELSERYKELEFLLKACAKEIKEHDKTFEGIVNSIPENMRDHMHEKYRKLREKQLNSLIEAIIEWSSKEDE